ncbi:MAG: hypothetical protein BalsKO_23860 [Balneolaceae bacterium]
MKLLVTLFTLSIVTTLTVSAQVDVGEEAPSFDLQVLGQQNGVTISLSELDGKVVYIFFYGAGCPHCRSNGPVTENEIFQSFKTDTSFVALGIDTWNQSSTANNGFRAATGITYDLLLNGQNTLVAYYGGTGFYDRSVVIGTNGTVIYKGTGFVNSDFQDVKNTIDSELSSITTTSEDFKSLPSSLNLEQNYPNPFNPSTTISYQLTSPSNVKLEVFNLLGKEIATLVDGFQPSGEQSVYWNATQAPSGIYIYRLTAGNEVITKRMMLIK